MTPPPAAEVKSVARRSARRTSRPRERDERPVRAAAVRAGCLQAPRRTMTDTDSSGKHKYQQSYAFRNNLHGKLGGGRSGAVLAIFGAEPRHALAPPHHEGEGVLASLDPARPPQHYYAVVSQEHLARDRRGFSTAPSRRVRFRAAARSGRVAEESRHRRGRHVDMPRRAAPPRLRCRGRLGETSGEIRGSPDRC